MKDENETLRTAVANKAKDLISKGKNIFGGTFTNGGGDPMLDFSRNGPDNICATYCLGHRMWHFTFTNNEIFS